MLYDTSSLMICQVKKYSGLNFARKIRYVAPDVSSKIWYCGTSIGLTYDGLIASANFCKIDFALLVNGAGLLSCFVKIMNALSGLKRSIPAVDLSFLRSPSEMF